MVLSMTGFARTILEDENGTGVLEMRSLNHRHLDISIRLPEVFRSFEEDARELIKSRVSRGKIDCYLNIELYQSDKDLLAVDENRLHSLASLRNDLSEIFQSKLELNLTDILKWPNVMKPTGIRLENFSDSLSNLFNRALDDLLSTREREGRNLKNTLEEKLGLFREQFDNIKGLAPTSILEAKKRYQGRMIQLAEDLDIGRLEQECALLIQKLDISEELDRIESHLEEMIRVIERETPVGRRLDFMLQELGRETNTLGAKSSNSQISTITIEMKVLLEQMREQVQNIE